MKVVTVKVPCDCVCHQSGMTVMHFAPCCENGLKDKLLKVIEEKEIDGKLHQIAEDQFNRYLVVDGKIKDPS